MVIVGRYSNYISPLYRPIYNKLAACCTPLLPMSSLPFPPYAAKKIRSKLKSDSKTIRETVSYF